MICVLNGVTWRTGPEHSTGAGDHVESVLHSAVCNDNYFKEVWVVDKCKM